jgi:hypothetical protein
LQVSVFGVAEARVVVDHLEEAAANPAALLREFKRFFAEHDRSAELPASCCDFRFASDTSVTLQAPPLPSTAQHAEALGSSLGAGLGVLVVGLGLAFAVSWWKKKQMPKRMRRMGLCYILCCVKLNLPYVVLLTVNFVLAFLALSTLTVGGRAGERGRGQRGRAGRCWCLHVVALPVGAGAA